MIVIGLTGGIGTGKSEVSRAFCQLGAVVVDADKVGHQVYLPHSEAWREVMDAFGRTILQPNGEIDRKKLGDIVFNDPKALEKLNAITHPRMYGMLERRIKALQKEGVREVVLEAAVLIEANWVPLVDEVWVTTGPEDEVVRRIHGRSGLSRDTIRSRIRSQLSEEERVRHADVVIENDGDLAALREKVESLWNSRIMARRG